MADDKIIHEFQNNDSSECALEAAHEDRGEAKGQVAHRFVNNFHIHQGGQNVKCGNCGADKTCPRCESTNGKYHCGICGMWISANTGHIAEHQRMHTEERPFECSVCQKSFKKSDQLSQHDRIHSGTFPFICETCGDSFRQQGHLDTHQRSLHSDERSFECQQCTKAFKVRGSLMGHYRKVHNCSYSFLDCGEKFRRRNTFTAHSAKHVKDKAESTSKIVDCKDCSFEEEQEDNDSEGKRL